MRKPSPIYLDYASLTPIDERVLAAVTDIAGSLDMANPSSIYMSGVRAKKALEGARAACAGFFHAHADEIIFTANGTESNNIALLGVVEKLVAKENAGKSYTKIHIIVSAIEHASVLEVARALKAKGVEVDILPVTSAGIVDVQVLKKMLKPTTALVSVMTVNNEIGTIQPIADIVKIVRDFKKEKIGEKKEINRSGDFLYPLVHTDACQGLLYLDINPEKLGVDLLTADSQKVYGPRGVGMLYVRRSARELVAPVMFGGGQEGGLRPGTENVAGIVGFAKALEIAALEKGEKRATEEKGEKRASGERRAKNGKENETERVIKLRDYCIEQVEKRIPGVIVNGDRDKRIANNINITIPGVDHEFLLLQLDVRGVSCSTKSSCLRDEDESYVVAALRGAKRGDTADIGAVGARQALRFSLGRATTKKDINFVVKSIDECLHL